MKTRSNMTYNCKSAERCESPFSNADSRPEQENPCKWIGMNNFKWLVGDLHFGWWPHPIHGPTASWLCYCRCYCCVFIQNVFSTKLVYSFVCKGRECARPPPTPQQAIWNSNLPSDDMTWLDIVLCSLGGLDSIQGLAGCLIGAFELCEPHSPDTEELLLK